jgi:hypothetical protein
MIVTRKSLSRRTVLRGLGTAVALPYLDAMTPAFAARAGDVPLRLSIIFAPMGMSMTEWTPPAEGPLQLSPILQPLAAFTDRMVVLSGLDSKEADGTDGGIHPRCQGAWLTGVKPKRTEGPDMRIGTSMDQIAAASPEVGQRTELASLELSLEPGEMVGNCAYGYTCAYLATISWRTPTMPLPMEHNPRAVFERLFGTADSTDARARLREVRKNRSILDTVTGKIGELERRIDAPDRVKLAEYLDAVREIERRIQKTEERAEQPLPLLDQPAGIPATFEEHLKLMFDLLTLAFQSDLTRVSAFMIGRELSSRAFPEIGVPEPWHPLSHHANNPEKLAKQAKLNAYHMSLFAHLLEKMRAIPDGDGSLLDHTVFLYGSSMSDSNLHRMYDVPTLVVGGPAARIKGGRHVRYKAGTPLANLQLSLLDKVGVRVDQFGDSTGKLDLLAEI